MMGIGGKKAPQGSFPYGAQRSELLSGWRYAAVVASLEENIHLGRWFALSPILRIEHFFAELDLGDGVLCGVVGCRSTR